MSQIRNITIEGFRSIKSIKDLELRPLNVLIGANGSGKSNFLKALMFLRTVVLRSGDIQRELELDGGASRMVHLGPKVTPKIGFKVCFADDTGEFNVELNCVPEDSLSYLLADDGIRLPAGVAENRTSTYTAMPKQEILESSLSGWNKYHFQDTGFLSPMKTTTDIHDNRELRPDGSNLAAYLYLLREKHEHSYGQILNTVKMANPFIEDFAMKPQRLNEQQIRLEWRQKGSDAYFDVYSFADGTLRFIALTTLLLQPESMRPSLVLLDEPELGLHPYAIHLLAAMLDQASLDSQIIVATQSPILLDHFSPEDVLVAERVSGATEFHRLDGNRLKEWLKDYSLGQLWEQNEFGGQPLPEFRDGKDHR